MINIRAIVNNLFLSFSSPEEAPLSESERLLVEIEETKEKMNYAWERLNYAAPEYVEIVVLELLIIETQYGLLNRRYRLLLGIKDDSPFVLPSAAKALAYSMASRRQNHAFYGSLFNPTTESPSLETPLLDSMTSQFVTQSPYQS